MCKPFWPHPPLINSECDNQLSQGLCYSVLFWRFGEQGRGHQTRMGVARLSLIHCVGKEALNGMAWMMFGKVYQYLRVYGLGPTSPVLGTWFVKFYPARKRKGYSNAHCDRITSQWVVAGTRWLWPIFCWTTLANQATPSFSMLHAELAVLIVRLQLWALKLAWCCSYMSYSDGQNCFLGLPQICSETQ